VSTYDDLLAELGGQVDALPRRSASLVFLACGEALLPDLREWARLREQDPDPLLAAAAAGAESYALRGLVPAAGMRLLSWLEAATPPGDQPDATTAATAQDCWICFDVAVRIAVDRAYHPGTAVEYSLEPVIGAATLRLHGVTQVGSGPDEADQLSVVLADAQVAAAIGFWRWVLERLVDRDAPTADDAVAVRQRAFALQPT
jgi:hypothetical protein